MADAKTILSDVIVPSVFLPYMVERTAVKSELIQSGIVVRTPEFDRLVSEAGGVNAGAIITMPFWTDISAASAILSDSTGLETQKLDGSKSDKAVKHGRGTAYSINQLVGLLADTDDPMAVLADLIGAYWAREDQTLLLATLKGVFAALDAESGDPNLLKIGAESIAAQSDATKLTGETFVDALQKLGDAKDKLTGVIMHSATEAALMKRDLIDFVPDSESKAQIRIFMGRRVIVDDTMPTRAGTTDGTVYTTYLFGEGAIAYGEKDLSSEPVPGGFGSYGMELARTANVGDSKVFFRRIHMMHPRGIAYGAASQASTFPTNTELETTANWTRKFESKNIRIARVDHNN